MARSPSTATPTDFGWTLKGFMAEKKIKNPTALSKVMGESGYPISQQMISNYINGRNKVPIAFVSAAARVLDLDDEEQDLLANRWVDTLSEEERAVVLRIRGKVQLSSKESANIADFEGRVDRGHSQGDDSDARGS